MPDFILNRNYTLRSLSGHIINFKKGTPTFVPPMIEREAVQIGAEPLEGKIDALEPEVIEPLALTADERRKRVFVAFEQIMEGNEREAFTAQGVPTKSAIESLTGVMLTTKERQELWNQYRESKQEA
jgi:hypothetical protein